MAPIDRRTVLRAALAAVPAITLEETDQTDPPKDPPKTKRVPAGQDLAGKERKVFGTLPITCKVSAQETHGDLLIVEQNNAQKGGPPRHLHLRQEEWFYVVRSEYLVEIDGVEYRLGPGDSVLAPRNIPHTWAYVGKGKGTLLVTFQPAGQMEAFFTEATKLTGLPPQTELAALFTAHEMQLTGPPLEWE